MGNQETQNGGSQSAGASTGSALDELLISRSQTDFMRSVDELLVTLDSGTLAEGWCILNARRWPQWEMQIPVGHEQWAHKYLLNELTRTVPKKLRRATWDRFAPNDGTQPPPE